jgi:rare lipoprotein A (peptidoglycan hydrolase)
MRAATKPTFLLALLGRFALVGTLVALALPGAAALAATGGSSATGAPTGGAAGGAAPTPTVSGQTLATWFGPGFYGHTTACGQTMSPTLVGIASRTLPCGTLVQIGYRGRRLTVPVLDRGPYGHSGAVWDLTAGAAHALKIKETVRIATQIVGSVPNGPTLGLPGEPTAGGASGAASSTAAPSEPSASAAATGGATAG